VPLSQQRKIKIYNKIIMKLNKKHIMLGIAAIVIVACMFVMMRKPKSALPPGEKFIVYGTEWCGYTTKQRKHLDNKYGPDSHEFVDCDKGNCPKGINAFPVTKTPNGDMVKGFNVDI
jgi:hypothetical protein